MASRPPPPRRPGPPAALHALRWSGWAVAAACVLLKATVGMDPFPHWASDATRLIVPVTAMTPAISLLVDAITLLACGVALLGDGLLGARFRWWSGALWAAGAAGVAIHAFAHGGSLDNTRLGLGWAAAMAVGLTAFHVCRDSQVRRVTLAAGFSLVSMLVAKGALEYFLEHPQTAASFRENREALLAAQGWSAGSQSARAFERRLFQAEATGWFGMANVYASFVAAGLVVFLGWALHAWKKTREQEVPSGWTGVLFMGAIASAGGLWMAGSKGGIGATILGLGLLAMVALAMRAPEPARRRITRWGGAVALSVVALALLAVVLRGAVGERSAERSLLFRWFYMIGAVRIFLDQPLTGSGPAGFKDSYMIAKPAISPEDVASPHSVLLDMIAMLGLFGLAWAGLWLAFVYNLGRRLFAALVPQPALAERTPQARVENWLATGIIIAPWIAGTMIERLAMTPDAAAARLIGLIGSLALATASLALMRVGRWRWIAAAAGLVLAAHSQIEMTSTWPNAAGACMLLIGAAGAPVLAERARRSMLELIPGAALAGASIAIVPLAVMPVAGWQSDLEAAAEAVRPSASMHDRAARLFAAPGVAPPDDSISQLATDLGHLLGTPPPTTEAGFAIAMNELLARSAAGARGPLQRASARYPRHFPTTEALVRLMLAEAMAAHSMGRLERVELVGAEAATIAADHARLHTSSSAWAMVATTEAQLATLLTDPHRLAAAAESWEIAAVLDPHGPTFALRAMETHAALGNTDQARKWARETLARDELQRLDDLRRLTPAEQARVDAVLR